MVDKGSNGKTTTLFQDPISNKVDKYLVRENVNSLNDETYSLRRAYPEMVLGQVLEFHNNNTIHRLIKNGVILADEVDQIEKQVQQHIENWWNFVGHDLDAVRFFVKRKAPARKD